MLQNSIVSHLWTGIRETGCHINKHIHKNHWKLPHGNCSVRVLVSIRVDEVDM